MSQPAQPGRREPPSSNGPIGALVIHDEVLFRTGVRALIATHPLVDVVADAATVADATVLAVDPDVILAGSSLFGAHNEPGAAGLRKRFRGVPIVVVGPPDDFASIRAVIAMGATGYVTTRCHPDELAHALLTIAGGKTYLEPSIGVAFARWDTDRQRAADRLSHAEREVLHWIALGYTNREVAALRQTSARTVEGLRAGIVRKLGFGDRAGLVRFARRAGIVDDELPEPAASPEA